MKVTEALSRNKYIVSVEITPPNRGKSVKDIFSSVEKLLPFNPKFINVTYHQPTFEYVEKNGVVFKKYSNKKPGTLGISAAIQHQFGIDSVPHIICGGNSKYEIEDLLIDMNYLGFDNVFVVRGDSVSSQKEFVADKNGYLHTSELVSQISLMNKGKYIDSKNNFPSDFCIGVAAYPEKHLESPNLDKDIEFLKKKIDAGADYIITQMCFDADVLIRFQNLLSEKGIDVPLLPGIKPIVNVKQLKMIPKLFNVSIPKELVDIIEYSRTQKEAFDKATTFMAEFVDKLISFGFPGIHLFTMGKSTSSVSVLSKSSFFS